MKVMIGQGKVIHEGFQYGSRKVAICGAGANRTGRNLSAFCIPVEDFHPVTCEKCLAKLAERAARNAAK